MTNFLILLLLMQVMANLNFQQPPRSIVNASLPNRGNSNFGSSLSGHVTPTSGMFPVSSAFNQQQQSQPPQLSPNRNTNQFAGAVGAGSGQILSANRQASMVNQRGFGDRRPMPGIPGPMVSQISVPFYSNF